MHKNIKAQILGTLRLIQESCKAQASSKFRFFAHLSFLEDKTRVSFTYSAWEPLCYEKTQQLSGECQTHSAYFNNTVYKK